MMKGLFRHQSGQAAVLIALALTVIAGMLALILDGGYIYLERRRMQNAADAAAFAGARELALRADNSADSERRILRQINTYAERNGTPDTNGVPEDENNNNVQAYFLDSNNQVLGSRIGTNGYVPANAVSVLVQARKEFPTFIAGIIGSPTAAAQAISQARYGPVSALTGLAPIAVRQFNFAYGQTYTIWDDDKTEADPTSGIIVGGQRGWLNFNGGNVSNDELRDWMLYGYNGRVETGMWINGDPGTRSSAVQAAGERIGQVIIVPIYDTVRPGQNGNGTLDYHIVGFGAFRVTAMNWQGNPKTISGRFERYVAPGDWGTAINAGVVAIRLTAPAAVP